MHWIDRINTKMEQVFGKVVNVEEDNSSEAQPSASVRDSNAASHDELAELPENADPALFKKEKNMDTIRKKLAPGYDAHDSGGERSELYIRKTTILYSYFVFQ